MIFAELTALVDGQEDKQFVNLGFIRRLSTTSYTLATGAKIPATLVDFNDGCPLIVKERAEDLMKAMHAVLIQMNQKPVIPVFNNLPR